MGITDWLFRTIEISRSFQTHVFYLFMFFFSLFALFLAWRSRLLRLSLLLWACAAIIGLLWEAGLFAAGARRYSFAALAELLYHAVTEGGPGLIVMVVFADWVGLVDLGPYKEKPHGGRRHGEQRKHRRC